MQVLRRSVVALCAGLGLAALVGCGGLGVNIGSGSGNGSQVVCCVNIQTQVPPNIPNVTFGHTILMQSVAQSQSGSTRYVSSSQGTQWGIINNNKAGSCPAGLAYTCTQSSSFTSAILLFQGDCVTPYNFLPTQTVCVFAWGGPTAVTGTAGLTAAIQGKVGQVTITIQ